MDKNIIKIICLIVALVAFLAAILFVLLSGIHIGSFHVVSVTGISSRDSDVAVANESLAKAEKEYNENIKSLETAKKDFETQKQSYESLGEETISAIKEATKEEEYFIEYLWITLGNYATKHNLKLVIVEPGRAASIKEEDTTNIDNNDPTSVSTGTGVNGNSEGVSVTNNSATTGLPTSETQLASSVEDQTSTNNADSTSVTSSVNDLTVQIKGSYIDVADFVFEVENDKSLRFRLDNIKMKSAGGTDVTTTFNVKDFTVLKSLK